jgi:hypothetical protein
MQVRLALFLSALLAVLGLSTAIASASGLPGDNAILSTSPFRLNPYTLEPSCYRADRITDVDSHMLFDSGIAEEAHITVEDGSAVSVDQVLVPSPIDGYNVVNDFDTGTINNDPDIDPGQTATGLRSLTKFVDNHDVIVCVSQHGDAGQNEPYAPVGNGDVTAKNRPTITPTLASLGVSPIGGLHTFKIGFGYTTAWYADPSALFDPLFPVALTDPQLLPFPSNAATFVGVDARPAQPGVRRVNDIDVAGEQYSPFDADTADHGQVQVFRKAGDPYSFCVAPDNCGGSLGVGHLLAFDAQGDLPISWTVKPSLADDTHKKTLTVTDDYLRAWNASWLAYYAGKGPKPTLPLAPGTNSPDPDPSITVIVNPQLSAPASGGAATPVATTVVIQQAGAANAARSATGSSAKKASKASIRSARVIATKSGKRVVVFVKSASETARIQIRMYGANGRKVGQVTRTVRTNRSVKVSGVRVASKVKTVKVTLVG